MSETTAVSKESTAPREEAALVPPVDVIEDSGGITLYADLPGVPKDKLNLHVDSGTLTIEGELGLEMPEAMESTHAEVSLPRYRRSGRRPASASPAIVVALPSIASAMSFCPSQMSPWVPR